jgi:hypothetical protein
MTTTSFGGPTNDGVWLYPGRVHGSPLTAASIALRLRNIGVPPSVARRTALTSPSWRSRSHPSFSVACSASA